ncbi:hypothetical protein PMCN06_1850 [Pasteurella multocida subsp. multocida str. HN06]|nr:hypothetical protein PMCN06_1850 [Pasteurella multocida subsp. multocida str. HN06]
MKKYSNFGLKYVLSLNKIRKYVFIFDYNQIDFNYILRGQL